MSVLFAVLALDWSSNMIVVSNAVAFLNVGRGNSIWFGLAGFSSYKIWSDCSVLVSSVWSLFCPCWSGEVRTVLVWSSWSGLIAFALFCFAHLVCIGLVEAALFQAGVLSLSSVLSCSLCSVLVWSTLLYSRLVRSCLFG